MNDGSEKQVFTIKPASLEEFEKSEVAYISKDVHMQVVAERDALAAEVERLRGNLEDAASAVEWGARRMETQSYKVLMEKWASEYRAALKEGKDG